MHSWLDSAADSGLRYNHCMDHPAKLEVESQSKPMTITSGRSQAEGIAKFAHNVTYEDLTPERRERLKISILDSLACAISAIGAAPIKAYFTQAKEFGGSDARCTLIGGGKANVVYASAYNTAVIRYIDFMDSYFAVGGLCHPSDNVAAVLAVSEYADRSGKDFLIALAVAYQVECALTAAAPFLARGLDLTTPLTYSLGAGVSKALGLDEAKTAVGIVDLRRLRRSSTRRADDPDLAMEGTQLVPSGVGLRPRRFSSIARRNRSEVCNRGTERAGPCARAGDLGRLGQTATGLFQPGFIEELQQRRPDRVAYLLHA